MLRLWVMKIMLMPRRSLQPDHEFKNFELNGDVKGGRRLVGDEKIGTVGKRHGDHHPLALAAGHFMGVGAHAPFGFRES